MLNISEPPHENHHTFGFNHPIFELAFRPYFLLGSFTSIVALVIWLASLNGLFYFDHSGLSPIVWHAHEMIFGFAATVAVGFILTAVQTWAGRRSLSKKPLAALVLLWCAMRLTLWINTLESIYLGTALTFLWWLCVVVIYTKIVVNAQNRRNYLFIPILLIMASLNIAVLYFDIHNSSELALHLSRTAVILFTLLMTVVGGRVIPFFTVRGANTLAINMPKLLEHSVLILSALSVLVFAIGPNTVPASLFISVMVLTSSLQLCRLGFWRSIETRAVPLLWSLHVSYLMMAIGILLLAVSQLNMGVTVSTALHVITIGAIGLMIISMMSRVSLGHTGRALAPKLIVSVAFVMIAVAAVVRVVLPYFGLVTQAWWLSVMFWICAHTIFLLVYFPILTSSKRS